MTKPAPKSPEPKKPAHAEPAATEINGADTRVDGRAFDNFLRAALGPTPQEVYIRKMTVILQEVADEVGKAHAKHAPMHSPHEGHSVIREELDELWDEIKADRGRQKSARDEAIQVAAMGIRYVLDLDPH